MVTAVVAVVAAVVIAAVVPHSTLISITHL